MILKQDYLLLILLAFTIFRTQAGDYARASADSSFFRSKKIEREYFQWYEKVPAGCVYYLEQRQDGEIFICPVLVTRNPETDEIIEFKKKGPYPLKKEIAEHIKGTLYKMYDPRSDETKQVMFGYKELYSLAKEVETQQVRGLNNNQLSVVVGESLVVVVTVALIAYLRKK